MPTLVIWLICINEQSLELQTVFKDFSLDVIWHAGAIDHLVLDMLNKCQRKPVFVGGDRDHVAQTVFQKI